MIVTGFSAVFMFSASKVGIGVFLKSTAILPIIPRMRKGLVEI